MGNRWHRHHLRVHYKETDQMGVVHHSNYVAWFEVGRTEKMRAVGIPYGKMEQLGLLLPVLDVNVKYHQPARYDDCVAIYTKLAKFTAVRMEFIYEVRATDDQTCGQPAEIYAEPTGELLASGKTVHMWINEKWRPARLDRVAPHVFKKLNNLYRE